MSYWRMKKQTELYKKMAGLPSKEVPKELIDAEEAYVQKKGRVERLRAQKAPDVVVSQEAADLAVLESRYRQLMVQFERSAAK